MNTKYTALVRLCFLTLLTNLPAFGQLAAVQRSLTPLIATPGAPTVTIQAAATGALLRSQAASNASLDLGRVSYFKGTSAPGQSSQKNPRSFVVSTRFALRVDCPGSPASSKVSLTVSRLDGAASHAITIDGTILRLQSQTLTRSMPCGSGSEHRMEVEVPVTTLAGSIGSTIAFLATLSK